MRRRETRELSAAPAKHACFAGHFSFLRFAGWCGGCKSRLAGPGHCLFKPKKTSRILMLCYVGCWLLTA